MKRIKAACICQTLHFMLKEEVSHDFAVRQVKEEVVLLLHRYGNRRFRWPKGPESAGFFLLFFFRNLPFVRGKASFRNLLLPARPIDDTMKYRKERESEMHGKGMRLRALKAAFPHTIPIFAGFWFLGMAYGIFMNVSGFGFWYPMVMSLTIFGGSLEFVAVSMLLGSFAPLQTLMMALVLQARHLFYGVAMLEKYRGLGWKKFYLIFGLCDETFSINCSAEIPEGVDRGWFYFFVTLLNHFYWVSGSTIGGIVGSLLQFDTEGIGFVMTAMFTVIFLEQWLKEKRHDSSLLGLGLSALCLVLFGADSFIIPSMICLLVLLTALRRPIERRCGMP